MSVPDSRLSTHRIFIAVLVGVGLLIAVSFPFALRYDNKIDAQRAGYDAAAAVVRMQTVLTDADKAAVAFDIGPGEKVRIGKQTYVAGPGLHVVSETTPGGLCVQVTNDDPNIRSWTYDSADGEHPYDGIHGGACPN